MKFESKFLRDNLCWTMSEQEAFITKLTQIAIVQISQELENEGVRESSLNTFTEVIQRFIQEIGSTASAFANASGRTECNYFDIEASLKEVGYDVEDLVKFENNSYPLQTPIDIESLQVTKHNVKSNGDSVEQETEDHERIKIEELAQSIANNQCTHNGTVIFDSQKNIFEILDAQSGSHAKSKRKPKNKTQKTSKKGKKMKHIPAFCPDYPDNLLYKNTPIYYKGISHHEESNSNKTKHKMNDKMKEDNFEKTRKVLIANSNIFSDNSYENKNKRKLTTHEHSNNRKRQKLNNGYALKRSDKMENDQEDEDDQIMDNPYANM
eukprot:795517_1